MFFVCRATLFGYLVVSPKVLFSGKNESICVTISGSSEPVDVTLRFMEDNVTQIAAFPLFSVEFSTACSTIQVIRYSGSTIFEVWLYLFIVDIKL